MQEKRYRGSSCNVPDYGTYFFGGKDENDVNVTTNYIYKD